MHVYIDDNPQGINITEYLPKVSTQRQKKVMSYHYEKDRRTSLSAYLLLMKGLSEHYGIIEPPLFDFLPHGKPFMPDYPNIHFNISHCEVASACAISDEEVGIDIEYIREPYEPEYIRQWTRKEALAKMYGTGITEENEYMAHADEVEFETFDYGKYIYTICKQKQKNMEIITKNENGKTVLSIIGKIDTDAALELQRAIAPLLNPTLDLQLDCNQLEYISSSGLRVLIGTYKYLESNGGKFTLTGVQPNIMMVLNMTGFSNFLEIKD